MVHCTQSRKLATNHTALFMFIDRSLTLITFCALRWSPNRHEQIVAALEVRTLDRTSLLENDWHSFIIDAPSPTSHARAFSVVVDLTLDQLQLRRESASTRHRTSSSAKKVDVSTDFFRACSLPASGRPDCPASGLVTSLVRGWLNRAKAFLEGVSLHETPEKGHGAHDIKPIVGDAVGEPAEVWRLLRCYASAK